MTENIKHKFYQLIDQNQLSHAYLFTGDDYVSKNKLSIQIIQGLLCPQKDGNVPCLECDLCRRASDNQLADVIYLRPEGQGIKVDQVRDLKEWLSTSPLETHYKFAIIEQADLMNVSAANALLSFLEEPLRNVYMILYAQEASNLLPTILSRVQIIHFPGTSKAEQIFYLSQQGIQGHHGEILANLSTNSLEQRIIDYDEVAFSQWLEALNKFYALLLQGSDLALIHIDTQLKTYLTGQEALDSIDYLLLLSHSSLMLLNEGEDNEYLQSYFLKKIIKETQSKSRKILDINEQLLNAKEYILANVSGQLAFERVALSVLKND